MNPRSSNRLCLAWRLLRTIVLSCLATVLLTSCQNESPSTPADDNAAQAPDVQGETSSGLTTQEKTTVTETPKATPASTPQSAPEAATDTKPAAPATPRETKGASMEAAARLMTSVAEFGVTGNGDETAAIQKAIDSGRALFWPEGTYTFSTDLYLRANTSWFGTGYGTNLIGNGAGIRVDAAPGAANLSNWKIANMRIGRKGKAGSALFLGGSDAGGKNYAAIRGVVDSVWIDECSGHGIEIAVGYIIDLNSIIIRNCRGTAYYFHPGEGGKVAANAVKIFGGELQNNGKAVELRDTSGISFFGTTIEGNALGVDLPRNARQTSFFGSYFEANGGYDISVGSETSASGLMVSGGVFWDGGSKLKSGKSSAVLLYKATGVDIQGVTFSGYNVTGDDSGKPGQQAAGALAILDNPNWVSGTFQNLNLFDTPTALVVSRKTSSLKFYDVNQAIEQARTR